MKNQVPENAIQHQYTIKVTEEHLDELNHVNNITYLKWVQDASGIHWNLLATPKINEEIVWMVLRHEIDYAGQAFLDDELTITTWIGESSGVKSIRNVLISKKGKTLTKCKTTWCLLDKKTLRPKRIDGEILRLLTNQ